MKHSDLVLVAAKWLAKERCSVVVTEMASTDEIPDAIGWRSGFSVLVECKVSVADFRAEQAGRRNGLSSMGQKRYYLVPAGLITLADLPDRWGLLELTGSGVRNARESGIFAGYAVNYGAERRLLCSCLRRVFASNPVKGVKVRCYTLYADSEKAVASLGVGNEPYENLCEPPKSSP